MSLIVMKFGGTSVANVQRIQNAAEKVKKEYDNGNNIIVVVSAMSGVTNRLVGYVNSIAKDVFYDKKEYDAVVSSGEQITAGLMAISLNNLGLNARSWNAWQLNLSTTEDFQKAKILKIKNEEFSKNLKDRKIAVVTGFQGINLKKNRITTLGRGGSDTSAVALAAAFSADRCDIYTDVDGVYTADPRIVANAKKMKDVSHEEMLELASLGAGVLHPRSIEIAMSYNVNLQVRSSFNDVSGTTIVEKRKTMEEKIVIGVTQNNNESYVTINNLSDSMKGICDVLKTLTDNNVCIDMITQTELSNYNSLSNKTGSNIQLNFTAPKEEISNVIKIINDEVHCDIKINNELSKISIVGIRITSNPGVAYTAFKALDKENIKILATATCEIKVSVLVPVEDSDRALQVLHKAYGLDK